VDRSRWLPGLDLSLLCSFVDRPFAEAKREFRAAIRRRPRRVCAELSRAWALRIATVAGIPIRLHFTFLLFLLWIGLSAGLAAGAATVSQRVAATAWRLATGDAPPERQ